MLPCCNMNAFSLPHRLIKSSVQLLSEASLEFALLRGRANPITMI